MGEVTIITSGMKPVKGIIQVCVHCGEQSAGKYCSNCRTAEGRRKRDEENAAILAERKDDPA